MSITTLIEQTLDEMRAAGAVLSWGVAMPKGRTRYLIRDATGMDRRLAPGEAEAYVAGYRAIRAATASWTRLLPLAERVDEHRRALRRRG